MPRMVGIRPADCRWANLAIAKPARVGATRGTRADQQIKRDLGTALMRERTLFFAQTIEFAAAGERNGIAVGKRGLADHAHSYPRRLRTQSQRLFESEAVR